MNANCGRQSLLILFKLVFKFCWYPCTSSIMFLTLNFSPCQNLFMNMTIIIDRVDHSGHKASSVYGVGPHKYCDLGFEYRSKHGCM
jgi:hypothetical protein